MECSGSAGVGEGVERRLYLFPPSQDRFPRAVLCESSELGTRNSASGQAVMLVPLEGDCMQDDTRGREGEETVLNRLPFAIHDTSVVAAVNVLLGWREGKE